eukprot:m.210254 g.210254  ORF g.210254 m.210254 type:complete len:287 (-) comp15822_c0_seq7:716-1576(-)
MSDIVEGFVCPICRQDIGGSDALAEHYERVHVQGEDEGFLSKVRKRMGRREEPHIVNRAVDSYDFSPLPDQQEGVTRSHLFQFEDLRKNRSSFNDVQFNQLLGRLEKLLYKGPNLSLLSKAAGARERKDFERSVVPWMDDNLVPSCPNCAKGFGILRRRHHCRLCGGVLCGDCSLGISVDEAEDLLQRSAVVETGAVGDTLQGKFAVQKRLIGLDLGTSQGRRSFGTDGMLRVCNECQTCLFMTIQIKEEQRKTKTTKKKTRSPYSRSSQENSTCYGVVSNGCTKL